MKRNITFVDLFSGMGGFRLAFEEAGCSCVFSSDIDFHARKTYELNFGEIPHGDITKISSNEIPDFNILCAGFPCQPFSIAGKRLGFDDTRGTLFFEIARILKDKKPDAFFLENVKGIVNHNKGKTLEVILQTLNELGYYVTWKVLNTKRYGIPQNRERWYCVGFKKEKNFYNERKEFRWPDECELKYKLSDVIEDIKSSKYKISSICKQNIKVNIRRKKIEIKEHTLAYDVRPSRCQFANSEISPCLTAKMGTGGNNVPIVISQNRRLTEKECLKLMGYPDSYKVFSDNQTYKQIGNSVSVPLIKMIAINILEYIEN